MPVSSRALVELLLLGPTNDRRQLQDSPILGDVFIAYAVNPSAPVDLLITPDKTRPAGPVAVLIAQQINALSIRRKAGQEAEIAYLHGLIAARLLFEELFLAVVPMTHWWNDPKIQAGLQHYLKGYLKQKIQAVINWVKAENEDASAVAAEALTGFTSLDGFITLAGAILWAANQAKIKRKSVSAGDALAKLRSPTPVMTLLKEAFKQILKENKKAKAAHIWQIALNRTPMLALDRSVPSVKGDAARTLFNVKCDRITWAVLDTGIDGSHPSFISRDGQLRIVKAYDFSNIRKIVNLDNLDTRAARFKHRLAELRAGRESRLSASAATEMLQKIGEDAENDRPTNWELVEKFIEIDPRTPPRHPHGTHVAGIIGAYSGGKGSAEWDSSFCDGMCPDIRLYDFRVVSKSLGDTEFAIIAALQFIRYLNDRYTHQTIHGANLSLSIPHDVRNYACGRTPICMECERLVESGVVVVAPAGNFGYHTFMTAQGSYTGYAAFSITDPGNAESVITVGATHRDRPHTYGVSFFSSRGPTGDGRLKPDLVAPGERIESCLPGGGWGELDGTSMAAPHVSGAAAMLMGRYQELIGEPRKIKKILCENATDLGRDRSFQGYGMLDVLRALQSR